MDGKTRMTDELRNEVWNRDKGTCQKCGRRLYKVVDPYEGVIEALLSLKDIKIFKWVKNCWKCHEETPVVTYDFALGYNYHIGEIGKIDQMLMKMYPFVKRVFSKTMEEEVTANICVNCGALQGNWFIMEDLIKMKVEEEDMAELVDTILPINLEIEDIPIEKEDLKPFRQKLSLAHVHHIDGDRENNDLHNLVLLCRTCHVKTHSESRS